MRQAGRSSNCKRNHLTYIAADQGREGRICRMPRTTEWDSPNSHKLGHKLGYYVGRLMKGKCMRTSQITRAGRTASTASKHIQINRVAADLAHISYFLALMYPTMHSSIHTFIHSSPDAHQAGPSNTIDAIEQVTTLPLTLALTPEMETTVAPL